MPADARSARDSASDASTRDVILDAAERVVAREGARRLTIDAVVRESGFSKGGVLYNFPSKLDLVRGMVERMVAFAETAHAEAIAAAEASGEARLPALVRAALRYKETDARVSMALLAAAAEHPELIDPVRDAIARMREDVLALAPDPDLARIVMLAADGLHFADILGMDLLTEEERARVEARLVDLVSEPRP